MDRPPAVPDALAGETQDADLARQSSHIHLDASAGTGTQMANLMEGDTGALSLPDVLQPADASDDDPEPPTTSPPGDGASMSPALRPSLLTLP